MRRHLLPMTLPCAVTAMPAQAAPSPVAAAPRPPTIAAQSMPPRPAVQARGKVRSLADMAKDNDESDDDEQNEYYAGGEKSGQVPCGTLDASLPCCLLVFYIQHLSARRGTAERVSLDTDISTDFG